MTDLQALRDDLRAGFIQRDDLVDGALIALLAGEHLLMVGPVGTAKSMLASAVCERLEGGAYFSWLLTRFSTPEELFGPVSLRALEEDIYRRVTTDKLPEAHIAFVDEIFKANSSILNSLLAVMNERIFHDGTHAIDIPLIALFAASNELPDESELQAVYDRFLLRYYVEYIDDDADFMKLLTLPPATDEPVRFTLADLSQWRSEAAAVSVPNSVLADIAALRNVMNEAGIEASDRRYRKAISVLQARAYLEGRSEVAPGDLHALEHVLWQDPEERHTVRDAIEGLVERFERAAAELADTAEEIEANASRRFDLPSEAVAARMEALTKLTGLRNQLYELCEDAVRSHRLTPGLEGHRDRVDAMLARLLEGVG